MEESQTLKEQQDATGSRRVSLRPHLFRILEGDDPTSAGARFDLYSVDEILVGRGRERRCERVTVEGKRRLILRAHDRWQSALHARIRRDPEGWILEDAGSSNGSFIRGHSVTRAVLEDGDSIRLGHTFYRFRAAVATPPDTPADVDLSNDNGDPALATTIPGLASDYRLLARMARSAVSIILQGETGTGKELIAQAIHKRSERSGTMVAINCGAIPRGLVQAHLFGHTKGAFTGATRHELGLVRAADGGTLLLDEVDELDQAAQVALLRVIQERRVTPVGSSVSVPVDVRFVSATHESLRDLCDGGLFRPDLLARLDGFSYHVRPLRERIEDHGTCVAAILNKHRHALEPIPCLSADVVERLLSYRWPSNIRELEQCLLRCCTLVDHAVVKVHHLPQVIAQAGMAPGERDAAPRPGRWSERDSRTRRRLIALMAQHDGNVTEVAKALGKARMQVQRWIKRFEIDAQAYRSGE